MIRSAPIARRQHQPTRPLLARSTYFFLPLLLAATAALADEWPVPVSTVTAPSAQFATVSDGHAMLVIGQSGQTDHHLAVYALDGAGKPGDAPRQTIALPCPDSLQASTRYPLSAAFHPALPLLYVWQDIQPAPNEKALAQEQFPHLVIYRIDDAGKLAEASAVAMGADFAIGQTVGDVAIEPGGTRLFMPNLQARGRASIGYFDLDEQGMPVLRDVPIPGTLDGFGLNKFEQKLLPHTVDLGAYQQLPTGLGFVTTSPDAVLTTTPGGVAVWDTQNRRAKLGIVRMPGVSGAHRLAANPDKPVVYGALPGGNVLFDIQHADGYPTLLPKVMQLPGAGFTSAPLAVPGASPVVLIGGDQIVHAIGLDPHGRLTSQHTTIAVPNTVVRAMARSPRFGRVYIPTEATP